MTAGSNERRTLKIRRRGRHTTPSQVEKVAAQAGKAAPAVAIAGALVAVPTAQQASAAAITAAVTAAGAHGSAADTTTAAHTTTATGTTTAAKASAQRTYTVRGGDTLSLIAQQYYHQAADWQWLYHENASTISDPNVIYAGQRISVPVDPPTNFTLSGYQPKHAKPATGSTSGTSTASTGDSSGTGNSSSTGSGGSSSTGTTSDNAGSSSGGSDSTSGSYSCSALESLWESAGGNSSAALIAAEIARAESGGNPNALSPTNDYGLWQINGSNGSLATFNPYQNAKSAIILSGNGTNWDAWTTYTSGAFQGRC
jgi:LysM repeat protein